MKLTVAVVTYGRYKYLDEAAASSSANATKAQAS
jgi:hypothetical protein